MAKTGIGDRAGEVFAALAAAGQATRPQLAVACGLSKPTVSLVMAELETAGLAEHSGTSAGATGRTAAVYRLGPRAGYVLAVDRGSTQVALRATRLDGELLDEDHTSRPADAAAMVEAVLRRGKTRGPLRAVVVAVSDVVSPPGRGDPAIMARVRDAVASLGLPDGAAVHTENNVNCAALAELAEGAGAAHDSFVFLQVGVGIGAGIVLGGQLVRGASGAAGEVARLAYPWAADRTPVPEGLEAQLGSRALLQRARSRWPGQAAADPAPGSRALLQRARTDPAPRTAAALFALAEKGHPVAAELVAEHAEAVGNLAASICAVVDPGLVVLGGGVGRNRLLLPGVVATVGRLSWPTEVVVSELGARATVLGAAHLARERGIRAVVTEG
ncbi:ROK family protein [Amycolatopsis sp. NEAU-NG30]|uniref:ROK family protein n=1 Tax=Amycolatopsis melonis TaxID=3156488 RepID=A0ABV0LMC0_9PSEU